MANNRAGFSDMGDPRQSGGGGNRQQRRERSAAPRNAMLNKITKFVTKLFDFLRAAVHLFWEIISKTMHLLVFFSRYSMEIFANPITAIFVSLIFFGLACLAASYQWTKIGEWLGHALFGLDEIGNYSTGFLGLLVGFGVNVCQMSPQLWRLRPEIAKVYADLGIDPHYESEDEEENPESQHVNRLSIDHKKLKNARLLAYGIEAALGLTFIFSHGLNPLAIAQTALSLLAPEFALTIVASAIGLMGKISDHLHDEDPDNVEI